jgi:hypothetical protein
MRDAPIKVLKKRRAIVVFVVLITLLVVGINPSFLQDTPQVAPSSIQTDVLSESAQNSEKALDVLSRLEIKGRAPKTGYKRAQFSDGWATVGGCDMRNIMLARGTTDTVLASDDCIVMSGTLNDPYTGNLIQFIRGSTTSDDVQIDHVVALSDAWQKGAQEIGEDNRFKFANDPLNLLAVDGPANQQKGDSDAASWLPPNKSFRCQYIARQIAVKDKYNLWVTDAEYSAMKRVLNGCGEQVVPISS